MKMYVERIIPESLAGVADDGWRWRLEGEYVYESEEIYTTHAKALRAAKQARKELQTA